MSLLKLSLLLLLNLPSQLRMLSQLVKEMTTRRETTEKEEGEVIRDLAERGTSIVKNVNTNPNTLRKIQLRKRRRRTTTALTPNLKFVPSESKRSDNLKTMAS